MLLNLPLLQYVGIVETLGYHVSTIYDFTSDRRNSICIRGKLIIYELKFLKNCRIFQNEDVCMYKSTCYEFTKTSITEKFTIVQSSKLTIQILTLL